MTSEVLGILPSMSDGGAERALIRILNDQSLRWRTDLIVLKAGEGLRELVSDRVVLHELGSKSFPLLQLLWLLIRLKPEVAFSTFGDVNIALSFIKRCCFFKFRLVLREPACPVRVFESSRFGWLQRYLYPFAYGWADEVIVLSMANRQQLVSIVGQRRLNIRVIDNVPEQREAAAPTVEVSGKYFIAVGRLVGQKGFDILVLAFKAFLKSNHDYRLYIVGDGGQREYLETLVGECDLVGKVVFCGQLENPLSIVASASAYVLSSRFEGVSNAMLEALMLGVPVIATTESTSADEYIVDGESGVLVAKTNVECLLEGMLKFASGHVKASKAEIRRLYCERLDERKMLALYENALIHKV